ncbi:hypothetical protein EDD29_5283 [Actinocorallia herbida]|uniref:Uncharacterized protein n=1 Tax=Actinocorallia herbida TaxID=58109 RepID=A0A3N1D2A7_9ACTN|nr:hypothetical protein EDD29_5283 [Actinocorallia herbida]
MTPRPPPESAGDPEGERHRRRSGRRLIHWADHARRLRGSPFRHRRGRGRGARGAGSPRGFTHRAIERNPGWPLGAVGTFFPTRDALLVATAKHLLEADRRTLHAPRGSRASRMSARSSRSGSRSRWTPSTARCSWRGANSSRRPGGQAADRSTRTWSAGRSSTSPPSDWSAGARPPGPRLHRIRRRAPVGPDRAPRHRRRNGGHAGRPRAPALRVLRPHPKAVLGFVGQARHDLGAAFQVQHVDDLVVRVSELGPASAPARSAGRAARSRPRTPEATPELGAGPGAESLDRTAKISRA